MLSYLAAYWYLLLLRGILAILFGITAILWPGLFFAVFVMFFGAYALVDGIFAIVAAVAGSGMRTPSWALVLEGLIGIAVGIFTFLWPAVAEAAMLMLIAAWAVITGVFEIAAAIHLRREIQGEWILGLSGVVSILFGLLLVARPNLGVAMVSWLVGIYAILFGILLSSLALALRKWSRRPAAASVATR